MSLVCPPILSAGKIVSIAPPLDVDSVPADSVGGKNRFQKMGSEQPQCPPPIFLITVKNGDFCKNIWPD
jgi:hypothetical protein